MLHSSCSGLLLMSSSDNSRISLHVSFLASLKMLIISPPIVIIIVKPGKITKISLGDNRREIANTQRYDPTHPPELESVE